MTVNEMYKLMARLIAEGHDDKELEFLCPDGFSDSIRPKYEIGDSIRFLSYKFAEEIDQ